MKTINQKEFDMLYKLNIKFIEGKIDGKQLNLWHCRLENINMQNYIFNDCGFYDCYFDNCEFNDCEFCDRYFDNCEFDDCNILNRTNNIMATLFTQCVLPQRIIQISQIGSQKRMTTYCFDDDYIRCGCYTGSLQEFESEVIQVHKDNTQVLNEYLGFINYLRFLKGKYGENN
jgi:hypothetical protein